MFIIKRFKLFDEETAGEGSTGGSGDVESSDSFDIGDAAKEIASQLGGYVEEDNLDDEDDDISGESDEETENDDEGDSKESTDKTKEEETEEEEDDKGDKGEIEPPNTWTKAAVAEWKHIPEVAKAEILKREQDILKGIEQYKGAADIGDKLMNLVAPYRESIASRTSDPFQFIDNILKADHLLITSAPEAKLQIFKDLAADYGVKLEQDGEVTFEDSTVTDLRQKITSLESKLDAQVTQTAETKKAEYELEVNTFASDSKNEHFNTVANDIAALFKTGVKMTLQEAYDKAVWANPVTRALEIAKLTAKDSEKKEDAEDPKSKNKSAKTGVRSIRRAPTTAKKPQSLDELLDTAYDSVVGKS